MQLLEHSTMWITVCLTAHSLCFGSAGDLARRLWSHPFLFYANLMEELFSESDPYSGFYLIFFTLLFISSGPALLSLYTSNFLVPSIFFNTCSFISLISFFCNILSFLVSHHVTPSPIAWTMNCIANLFLELSVIVSSLFSQFVFLFKRPQGLRRDDWTLQGISFVWAFSKEKKKDMICAWIEDNLN